MILKTERREEESWIDSAITGNAKAFSNLYRRYHNQVYAFCVRMLHGQGDAEDITQQVFLEAWRSLHRFEKRSLFSTWITRIAIHTCLSLHRRSGRIRLHIDNQAESSDKNIEFVWIESESSPHEQLQIKDQKQAINQILKTLSDKKKAVFILSDLQGMTAPEIANVLKIPDATVRTRLFHARKEFLDAINKNPHYKELLSA